MDLHSELRHELGPLQRREIHRLASEAREFVDAYLQPVAESEPLLESLNLEAAVLQVGPVVVVATQGSPITLATAHHPSAQLLMSALVAAQNSA